MPIEHGLELVSIIGSNLFGAEGELGDDIVDEGYGIGLTVALIASEGSNASSITDGGVLVALNRFVVFVSECLELHPIRQARNAISLAVVIDFDGSFWCHLKISI